MKIYKIRRKSDGKFSCGGTEPKFTLTGKSWNTLSSLKGHLRLNSADWKVYNDCEIVGYDIVESSDGPPFTLEEYFEPYKKESLVKILKG